MNNLTRAERIYFNEDLNRYYASENEAERIRVAKEDYLTQALEDAPLFRTLDDDYEIVDRDLVQRMLRNLNDACQSRDMSLKQIAQDAITTCLNQMMEKLKEACGNEVDEAENRK